MTIINIADILQICQTWVAQLMLMFVQMSIKLCSQE